MSPQPPLSLWRHHILPFTLWVFGLGIGTLVGDYLLHRWGWAAVGRYLGIPGSLLILLALGYSLRKRRQIQFGQVQSWLHFHEASTWLGSLMVLIHAGIHFNAVLPWLATLAMGVNVISGLVGKLLLGQAQAHVQTVRAHYEQQGLGAAEVEQALFWDSVAFEAMRRWRKVHIPIFGVFAVLSLAHIFSIVLFWGWR